MKKNLLAVVAVVFAITLSSFTVKRTVDVFLVYDGSGSQFALSNYPAQPFPIAQPAHVTGTSGAPVLNWLKITDDNRDITAAELSAAVTAYDLSANGSLNDEIDIPGSLDIKLPN